jgi:DNA repair exonuclease SbcCD ATPase subunit
MSAKITLTNWLSHDVLELPLDRPMTLVVGDHETGKSAIRDAIGFAWTGTLLSRSGFRQKKQIGAMAIRNDEKKTSVQLGLPGGFQAVRSVTRSGTQALVAQIGGETKEGLGEAQSAIYEAFGMDEGQAVAVLDSFHFLELGGSDQKELLFRTLGSAMTEGKIAEVMVKRGLCEETIHTVGLPALCVDAGFREAEKLAAEKRREAGRKLEHQMAEPQSVVIIGDRSIDLARVCVGAVTGNIESLQKERDKALRGGGEVYGAAAAMLEAVRPQAKALEEKINWREMNGVPPSPDSLAEEKERLVAALPGEREKLAALDAKIAAATATAQAASSAEKPEKCPAFGVECLATQAAIRKALGPIQKAAKEAQTKLDSLTPQRELMSTGIGEMEQDIERLTREISEATSAESDHEGNLDKLQEHQQTIRDCEARMEENKNAEPVDVAALEQRIALNEKVLEQTARYASAKASYDAEQVALARHREDHETWDKIAQALKPDGIETDLLALVMPEFIKLVNEITVEAGVGDISFTGDMEIEVRRPSGRMMLAPQLSRSARLRLGYGIQHAIARLVGFPILIVDELDVFNPKILPGVMTALLKIAKDYPVGVLGFATLRVGAPVRPQSDEVAMHWLTNGGIREVT